MESRKAVSCGIANSIAAATIIVITSSTCARFSSLMVLKLGIGHARNHQAAERERDRRHDRAQGARRIEFEVAVGEHQPGHHRGRSRHRQADEAALVGRRGLHVEARQAQRRANHEESADADSKRADWLAAPTNTPASRARRRTRPRRTGCRIRRRTGSRCARRARRVRRVRRRRTRSRSSRRRPRSARSPTRPSSKSPTAGRST